MSKPNYNALGKLTEKPLFRASEARKLGIHPSRLSYYVKTKRIERIGRGVYRGIHAQVHTDFQWGDLVLTAQSVPNGVICLVSALIIYELTDEMPRAHWIAIPHATTAPKRKNTRFVRMRDTSTGKVRLKLGEEWITIFDRERTIVDAFRYLSIEIAIKALKEAIKLHGDKKLDLRKLQKIRGKIQGEPYPLYSHGDDSMKEQALKDRLKLIAEVEKRSSQEVWKSLILERFLVRLAHSEYHDRFIFKGGFLLSYYLAIGRETTDIDLLAQRLKAEMPNIETAFREICDVVVSDGFKISMLGVEQLDHTHMRYPGYRARLSIQFDKMKDRIQVDIGTGDWVEPKQESLELYQYKGKPIFEGSVSLQVYPVETIFSEKLQSIIAREATNSRMKDFHDIFLLCREKELLNRDQLKASIGRTFQHRKTEKLIPIKFTMNQYARLQPLWSAHLRVLGDIAKTLQFPEKLAELVENINAYLIDLYSLAETESTNLLDREVVVDDLR